MTARRKPDMAILAPHARFLVDAYYTIQEYRIAAEAQGREHVAPSRFIAAIADRAKSIEEDIAYQLGHYARRDPVGKWLLSIYGIGPVISAGLLAHIDITKCPSPSALWRFAGQDPSCEWAKGEKRPWNAELKVLCWKIGQSFMKFSNNKKCFYGQLYRERKQWEIERNESGGNAEYAAKALQSKRYKSGTVTRAALEQGKLSPAHVDARARRWVVKLFLSHVWEVMYEVNYGQEPPKPYVFQHLGHVHRIAPPGWPMG